MPGRNVRPKLIPRWKPVLQRYSLEKFVFMKSIWVGISQDGDPRTTGGLDRLLHPVAPVLARTGRASASPDGV